MDLDVNFIASSSPERSVRQELRLCVLRQLLVWVTFADQLAALREADRCLLDKVSRHLLTRLSERGRVDVPDWLSEEAALCWRVLIVGWDHFCRSTH